MVWNDEEKVTRAKGVFDALQKKVEESIIPVPVKSLMLEVESSHVSQVLDEFTAKARAQSVLLGRVCASPELESSSLGMPCLHSSSHFW